MDIRDIELQDHQQDFYDAEEIFVLFGGGAGGGKTFSALVDNTKGIDDPLYSSVFFRTTSVEIEKSLWPEAKKMYHSLLFKDAAGKKPRGKAHINEKTKRITWPKGGTTDFAHLDTESAANSWFGIEVTRIYFEEFQFRKWDHFNVLRSRMRTMSSIPVGMRGTLNPDPDHFAYEFVERFIDEDGFPVKELSGKRAYFAIANDILYTSWEEEELLKEPSILQAMEDVGRLIKEDAYSKFNRHYRGDGLKSFEDFVYGYLNKEDAETVFDIEDPIEARKVFSELAGKHAASQAGPRSYTYIPATVKDNKELLRNNPGYLAELNSLPEKRRRALLEGCWKHMESDGIHFKRKWLIEVDKSPFRSLKCRAYDLASTEKAPGKDPDFTASVKMEKDLDGNYYLIGDYVDSFKDDDSKVHGRFRKRSGQRDNIILEQAKYDGKDCRLVLPEDPGAAAKDAFKEKIKFFNKHNIIVKKDPSASNANKLAKFEPFATAAEHGLIYIVRNTFSDETYLRLMEELERFDGQRSGRKKKDDWADAVATAYNHLAKEMVIPDFELPELRMPNPFNI